VPIDVVNLRIFIGSPSDLGAERSAFVADVEEYNTAEALPRGVLFEAVFWERLTGGSGRPQLIINRAIEQADYFLLAIGSRWGSATGHELYSSGTEEEFNVAVRCLEEERRPLKQIVLMFRAVDPALLNDPGPQLTQVLRFRKRIEENHSHFFHTYDNVESFRRVLRRYLAQWLRDNERPDQFSRSRPGHPSDSPTGAAGDVTSSELLGSRRPSERGTEVRYPPQPSLFDFTTLPLESATAAKISRLIAAGRTTEAEIALAAGVTERGHPADLLSFAFLMERQSRFAQAKEFAERAIRLAIDRKDSQVLSESYSLLGLVLYKTGDLIGAEQSLTRAVTLSDQADDKARNTSMAYGNLGGVRLSLGDLEGARAMFESALKIDSAAGNRANVARSHSNIGTVLLISGDFAGARARFHLANEIDQQVGRVDGATVTFGNIGLSYRDEGNLEEAETWLRRALAHGEAHGSPADLAGVLNNLASVRLDQGDVDSADDFLRRASEIAEASGDRRLMATIYLGLGHIAEKRNRSDQAERRYNEGLALGRLLGLPSVIEGALRHLTALARKTGHFVAAERYLTELVELGTRSGDLVDVAEVHRMLAVNSWSTGDYRKAVAHAGTAVEVARQSGDSKEVARAMAALVHSLDQAGDDRATEQACRDAIEACERAGGLDSELSFCCHVLGALEGTRGHLDAAVGLLRRSADLRPQDKRAAAQCYNDIGTAYLTANQFELAEPWLLKALALKEELGDKILLQSGYGNVGAVRQKRGDLKGAEEMFRKALAVGESLAPSKHLVSTYANLSINLGMQGATEEGLQLYNKGREMARQLGIVVRGQ
jgi:tetratricopeptide (TPR) repeat protein